MAHVLVRNNIVVKTINGLRPLTTTESANGGTRYPVSKGVAIYIGGTATVSSGSVTSITNPSSVSVTQGRRNEAKEWLRRAEKVPVSNWGLSDARNNGDLMSTRAQNYWWWLEMIAAASSVDGNLSDDTKWALIKAEMSWKFTTWYNDHTENNWSNVRNVTNFWSTESNGNYTRQTSISMPSPWEGLTNYIYD